jgi:hypothetical protein
MNEPLNLLYELLMFGPVLQIKCNALERWTILGQQKNQTKIIILSFCAENCKWFIILTVTCLHMVISCFIFPGNRSDMACAGGKISDSIRRGGNMFDYIRIFDLQ